MDVLQLDALIIFGSSDLAVTFIQHDLIDEYRIILNPVVLGSGKALFKGINERLNLKLIKTRTFRSGNVLLYYTSGDVHGSDHAHEPG